MSMAASLEARVPLLDHKLIEFVSRVPASFKLRGHETKYLLKKAVPISFRSDTQRPNKLWLPMQEG